MVFFKKAHEGLALFDEGTSSCDKSIQRANQHRCGANRAGNDKEFCAYVHYKTENSTAAQVVNYMPVCFVPLTAWGTSRPSGIGLPTTSWNFRMVSARDFDSVPGIFISSPR